MTAGFEPFSHYRIYSCFFTLHSKTRGRNHMNNCNSTFFQPSCPCFRISGRSKNNLHSLLYHDIHNFLYLRIHQRYVHTKRKFRSRTAFTDMLTQSFRMHGTCTEQPQSTCITHCGSKPPTATPYHSTLNYRILNP